MVVNALKHWKLPSEILSALEGAPHDGLEFSFNGAAGNLTCTVYVKTSKSPAHLFKDRWNEVRLEDALNANGPASSFVTPATSIQLVNELFCFFNSRDDSFSARCKDMIDRWNTSSTCTSSKPYACMKKMDLPIFQTIIKKVEEKTAAGPMLEAWSSSIHPTHEWQPQLVCFISHNQYVTVQSACVA